MVKGINNDLMALSIMANEKITELAGKENSFMQMEIFMKVSGKTIRLTVMAYIYILTTLAMKVNEKMISSMALVRKIGLTVRIMKEITVKVKNMAKVCCISVMDQNIKVILNLMILMAMVSMNGRMRKNMKEIDLETKCMERGKLFGKMEEHTVENMRMIKNTATEILNELMAESIKGSGKMESNMAKERILIHKILRGLVFGKMGKELDGLKKKKIINNDLFFTK